MTIMHTRIRPTDRLPVMRTWRAALAVSAGLLAPVGVSWAQAQAPTATAPVASTEAASGAPAQNQAGDGKATRAWLGAQSGRKQASSTRQTLSGPVMSTVHDRYVKSFAQPIEATPIRADMVSSGR